MNPGWRSVALAVAVAVTALSTTEAAKAEYPAPAPYIGVFGGATIPLKKWDLGVDTMHNAKRVDGVAPMVGARLGVQILKPLAVEGEFAYLSVPSVLADGSDGKATGTIAYNIGAIYQILPSDWTPFVGIGIGSYQSLSSGSLGKEQDRRFHVGAGLRGLLTPWLALRVDARDSMTDGFGNVTHLLEAHAGLDVFLMTAKKAASDRDQDGIADPQDKCPDEPGPKSTEGCPDRDGDGVVDKLDKCPDDKGAPQTEGCPDTDGDGLIDSEDKCPKEPGPKEKQGCPDQDRDKDGIADANDKCPDVPGVAQFAGCPDTDNDGIPDSEDKCPKDAGPKQTQGCPDRDKDTVIDSEDKCPDTPGLPAYQGCIPEAAKKFTGAIQGIYFDTGSAKIQPKSFKVLDEAVTVLKQFEQLRLRIEGHTDNVGKSEMNQKLSQDRADSVRAYLVSKGVAGDRIETAGFGDTRPAKPNDTPANRSVNRRIEFVPLGQK